MVQKRADFYSIDLITMRQTTITQLFKPKTLPAQSMEEENEDDLDSESDFNIRHIDHSNVGVEVDSEEEDNEDKEYKPLIQEYRKKKEVARD